MTVHPPAYTFDDLLAVWACHWRTVVWTFVLTLFPGLLVVFIMPPLYEARATLLVSRESRAPEYSIKATQADGATLLRNLERKEEINTQSELLKSRTVVEPVVLSQQLSREKLDHIRDFRRYVRYAYDWALDTAGWVYDETKYGMGLSQRPTADELRMLRYEQLMGNTLSRVNVQAVPDSSILQLTFRSSDPLLARDVVNGLTAAYLSARTSVRGPNAQGFFLDQAKLMAQNLEAREAELERLRRQFSVYSAEDQRKLVVGALVTTETTLKSTETALSSARARVAALRLQLAVQPRTLVTSREMTRNPNLDHLASRIIDLEVRRSTLAQSYQPESTTLKMADQELAAARQLLGTLRPTEEGTVIEAVNPIYQGLTRDLLAGEAEVAARQGEVQALSRHVQSLRDEVGTLNQNEVRLRTLERMVSTEADAYVLYAKNREQARVSQDMTAARLAEVRVVDTASLPIRPIRPRAMMYSGIVLAAALLLAAFAAFVAAYHDTSVSSESEAAQLSGIPVIALFPAAPMRAGPVRKVLTHAS